MSSGRLSLPETCELPGVGAATWLPGEAFLRSFKALVAVIAMGPLLIKLHGMQQNQEGGRSSGEDADPCECVQGHCLRREGSVEEGMGNGFVPSHFRF